jgi:hypothetical protein
MVGFPFDCKGDILKYGTGQPMGAYSSWNSFAVAHHYVVYYCARELGIKWSDVKCYVLLGDDIVIANDALAAKYRQVMSQLGVPINESKTLLSTHTYEFAKRIVHQNIEMTPFPLSGLWETRSSICLQMNLVHSEFTNKNWSIETIVPYALIKFYENLKLPRRLLTSRTFKLVTTYHLMIGVAKSITAREALMPILEKDFPDLIIKFDAVTDRDVYAHILKQTCIILFANSVEGLNNVSSIPFGDIATDIVIYLTCLPFDQLYIPIELISQIPILHVHGLITEKYMSLKKQAFEFDTLHKGEWKETFRALTIPLSDQVYVIHNQDLKMAAMSSLAKVLTPQLEMLQMYPQLI